MHDYREDPNNHYTPDEIRHAARAIKEAQPTLELTDSVAHSLAYAALSTVPKLSVEERAWIEEQLRPEAQEARRKRLSAAVQQDRELLAGVVDGVEQPDEELVERRSVRRLDAFDKTIMQAVTGLPKEAVDEFYAKFPPDQHGKQRIRDDVPVLWQSPVRCMLVGSKILAGVGDFHEDIAGTRVTLKDGDRVLYWHDHRSGAYVVRPGDWERAPDLVQKGSAWPVHSEPQDPPVFLSIEDDEAIELRITSIGRAQVAPLLRKAGYAPVMGAV